MLTPMHPSVTRFEDAGDIVRRRTRANPAVTSECGKGLWPLVEALLTDQFVTIFDHYARCRKEMKLIPCGDHPFKLSIRVTVLPEFCAPSGPHRFDDYCNT